MKRILLIVTAMLALGWTCAAQDENRKTAQKQQEKEVTVDDLFLDAMLAVEKEDYKEAAKLLEELKKKDPTNDAADIYLAFLYDGVNAKAEDNYKSAVAKDSTNYWYQYYLARYYRKTDRIELTAEILEDLIGRYPRKTDLYYELINIYLSQNDLDGALEMLDKIEKISGKTEQIGVTGADLRMRKGQVGEAYSYLENFYQDCATPRIATMLGDYYAQTYRDTLALDFYNQAIAMDSDYVPAYFSRGHVLRDRRDFDGYFSDMNRFMASEEIVTDVKTQYLSELMQNPPFVQAFSAQVDAMVKTAYHTTPADSTLALFTSYYLYQTGQTDESLEVILDNSRRHPESYNAQFECLMYYYSAQDWDKIVSLTDDLVMKYPDKADLFQLKGMAHWMRQETDDAIDAYQRMAALHPKDSATVVIAYTALGDLYHDKGDAKTAYKCYDKVLKFNDSYLPVLNNYAYYLSLENKNLKKAYKMSQITIKEEPDNATYLDTYGWILYLMDKPVEAKAIFKHAMLYGGKESAVMLDHYAEVLFKLGEYDLAFIYWNQAKVLDPQLGIDEKVKLRKTQVK